MQGNVETERLLATVSAWNNGSVEDIGDAPIRLKRLCDRGRIDYVAHVYDASSGAKTNVKLRLRMWLVADAFELHRMIIHRVTELQHWSSSTGAWVAPEDGNLMPFSEAHEGGSSARSFSALRAILDAEVIRRAINATGVCVIDCVACTGAEHTPRVDFMGVCHQVQL